MTLSPGDSSEQRGAEQWLLNALSDKLGVKLTKQRLSLENGSWIEVDGYCDSPKVVCEIWAHIGAPKSAQKNKVMTDAFKLIFVDTLLKSNSKRILLFADHEAASHFQGKSWMSQCLVEHDIDIEVIELPLDLRTKVIDAQKRQYR